MAYGKSGGKPKRLGIGDKPTISGDPNDMGLNARERTSNKEKPYPRSEVSSMKQYPTRPKKSISSDRGTFKCC